MSGGRITSGLANLAALADAAGLPARDWQATLLASTEGGRGDRTVIRLDHPDRAAVIVKQVHRAEAPAMAAGLAAQGAAGHRLDGHPVARVPRILAHLPERGAALIEAVPGVPMDEVHPTARALVRAGEWLDAFHRTGGLSQVPVRPQGLARGALLAGSEIEAGQRRVHEPRLFMRHLQRLRGRAEVLRGTLVPHAPRHGDFSGRNLLIGERLVWGIDFGPDRRGACVLDIARLLIFLGARTLDASHDAHGLGPGDLRQAFFAGYRIGRPDDPSLSFALAAGLLANWAQLPADAGTMSPMQARRFVRIVAMLEELAAEG